MKTARSSWKRAPQRATASPQRDCAAQRLRPCGSSRRCLRCVAWRDSSVFGMMKWTGEGAGVTHPNGDAAGDGCGEAEGDVACHSRSSVIHDSPEVSVEWAELALRVSSLSPSLSLSRSVCLALSLSITFPLSEGDPGASPRAALCASLTGQRSPRARLSLHWPPASALRHGPSPLQPALAWQRRRRSGSGCLVHYRPRTGGRALMPGRLQCPARNKS